MKFLADLFTVGDFGEGGTRDDQAIVVDITEVDANGVQVAFDIPSRKDRVFLTFQPHDLIRAISDFNNQE